MKIILTQIGHPNFRGGGNIVAHKLCEEFSKNGHSVTGVFLAPKNLLNVNFKSNYKLIVARGYMVPFLNVFQGWRVLRKILKIDEPDVVISLGYEGLLIPFIRNKVFFIAASHSPFLRYVGFKELFCDFKWVNPVNWGKWLFVSSFILDRITKLNADAVQSLCNFGASQCENIYKIASEKIFIIPNGIDAGYFTRKQLSNEKNLIFLGGSVEYKGLDVLVNAMPIISKSHGDIKVIILGEMGDERGKMILKMAENLGVKDKIIIKGIIPQERVKEFYKNVFLTVMPSRLDLFPMVALESMASGIPIVSSNVGGLPELVINNENGLVVEKDNPQKLAEAIIYLLDNQSKAEKMGRKGREIVEEKFTWGKIIEKFEKEIYKRIRNRL